MLSLYIAAGLFRAFRLYERHTQHVISSRAFRKPTKWVMCWHSFAPHSVMVTPFIYRFYRFNAVLLSPLVNLFHSKQTKRESSPPDKRIPHSRFTYQTGSLVRFVRIRWRTLPSLFLSSPPPSLRPTISPLASEKYLVLVSAKIICWWLTTIVYIVYRFNIDANMLGYESLKATSLHIVRFFAFISIHSLCGNLPKSFIRNVRLHVFQLTTISQPSAFLYIHIIHALPLWTTPKRPMVRRHRA